MGQRCRETVLGTPRVTQKPRPNPLVGCVPTRGGKQDRVRVSDWRRRGGGRGRLFAVEEGQRHRPGRKQKLCLDSRWDLKRGRARGCRRPRLPPQTSSGGGGRGVEKHPTTITSPTHKQLPPLCDKRRRFILPKCVEGACSRAKLWRAILCLCRSSR